ncbi:hypothetical protein LBMAG53_31450 [Planctomycetota bacterium]|nr:hypothetical protein LBMAG53_31450 [Planctomycetota bacterium]
MVRATETTLRPTFLPLFITTAALTVLAGVGHLSFLEDPAVQRSLLSAVVP